MQVYWENETKTRSPILFKHEAFWNEFQVKHLRVSAGEILEHTTEFNEVNLTLSGQLNTQRQTSTGKCRFDSADSKRMCLMPKGQTFSAHWKNEFEYIAVEFSQNMLSQTALEMNLSPNINLKENVVPQKDLLIQHLSLAFLAESAKNETSSRLFSESLAQTLMFHLIKNYTTAELQNTRFLGGISGKKLNKVKEFINENLEHDLTISEIASIADLSYFHFARSFRKTTGFTPQQYITNRRIEKAKELLAKSNLPIVEVGFQTGFKNQSHFTTIFRKFTSLTPKLWRETKQI